MNSKSVLPISKYSTSVKNIQAGAIFSRDWAPLHSDQDWAINKGNLPNIIMNNYTLNGLIIKYVTDLYGVATRIGKVTFKIKKPICPNETLEFYGSVTNENVVSDQLSLLNISLDIKISDQVVSSAKVIAGVNLSEKKLNSPWKIKTNTWKSYIDDIDK
tara:strand:- start:1895 stop:2371 length:477 start_codon:yes stop_codon:yes gene_type:complete